MLPLDSKKLEKLISAKKWDQVKDMLSKYFNSASDDKVGKGEKYVKFAHLYAKVSLALQEQYLEQLEKSLATINRLKKTTRAVDDKIKVVNAKKRAMNA